MKALEALYEAHKIAFSTFVFETAYTMLELGILDALNSEKSGLTIEETAAKTNVSEYGVRVLLEMADSAEIVKLNENNKYTVTKVGYFLLRDEMTKVNLYFTHEVCYNGLFYLKDSI